jgi:hypothetical protein
MFTDLMRRRMMGGPMFEEDAGGAGGGAGDIISGAADTGGGAAEPLKPYMAQLPDNLKQNKLIAESDNFGDLANRFLELHGKSEGAVKIPGEGATEVEIADFHKKLGIPDSAESYVVDTSNLPEGLKLDEEGVKELKSIAHKLKFTPNQAQGTFEAILARDIAKMKAEVDAKQKAHEAGVSALKAEWKGDYDKNVARSDNAIKTFGGDEAFKHLSDLKVTNDPVIIRIFSAIGAKISEDSSISGAGGAETKPKLDSRGQPMMVDAV